MSLNQGHDIQSASPRSSIDVARELGPVFQRRAEQATDEDCFVAENYEDLKSSGLVEAGVPPSSGAVGRRSMSWPRCSVSWRITADPQRLHSPCTPTRSPSPLGAGGIRK